MQSRTVRVMMLAGLIGCGFGDSAWAEVAGGDESGGSISQLATMDGVAVTIVNDRDGRLVGAQVSYYDGETMYAADSDDAELIARDYTAIVSYDDGEIVLCRDHERDDWEPCGHSTAAATEPVCDVEVAIENDLIVVLVQCGHRPLHLYMFCNQGGQTPPNWVPCGDFEIPTS